MQLTLKRRLWLGFGAIVAVVSLGNAMSWWEVDKAVEATKRMVGTNVQEQITATSIRADMAQAMSAVNAFLLSHDEQFVASGKETVTTVHEQLGTLAEIAPDAMRRQSAADAKVMAAQYLKILEELYALELRQGITMDTGAQGELRKTVHAIERKIQEQGVTELIVLMLTIRRHEKDYMLWEDEKYIGEVSQTIEQFKTQMQLSTLPSNVQNTIAGMWSTYMTALMTYVEAARATKAKKAELQHLAHALYEAVTTIAAAAGTDTTVARTVVLQGLAKITSLLLVILAVAATVGIGMAFSIIGAVTRPVQRIVQTATEIAEGNLVTHIEVGRRDELGQIGTAITTLAMQLHDSMVAVTQASNAVASAAQQLAAGAEQLSASSQEQAAALEETAASMEEMTATVKQNADNARQANQLSVSACEAAEKGGTVVTAAVASMDEITAASKKINEISSVIDEIAFQTNLLALNAAVEAARAGEQGRGFAVVAAEVRNLAQRSASAAKEIKGLIQNAGQKVADGTALVTQSGQTLQELVRGVKRVSDIVGEIAVASQEQARGIEQVNKTVTQMDHVTQDNAVQTEELSSTAQALAEQAQQLQTLVGRFRLHESTTQVCDGDNDTRWIAAPPKRVSEGQRKGVQPHVAPGTYSNGHVNSPGKGKARDIVADFEEF